MTQNLPKAILWDLDGTIVDSEPYWMEAELEFLGGHGINWTHEDALTLIGKGLWDSATIFQNLGVPLSADEIVDQITRQVTKFIQDRGIPWRPGARELLAQCRAAKVQTALVTMSLRAMAELVLNQFDFVAFDLIVAGDEVSQPKPHPEPYLKAAAALGVTIQDCIAIEDSPTGIRSAVTAGATTIGVTNILDLSSSPAHAIWSSLTGKSLTDLNNVTQTKQPRAQNAPTE